MINIHLRVVVVLLAMGLGVQGTSQAEESKGFLGDLVDDAHKGLQEVDRQVQDELDGKNKKDKKKKKKKKKKEK